MQASRLAILLVAGLAAAVAAGLVAAAHGSSGGWAADQGPQGPAGHGGHEPAWHERQGPPGMEGMAGHARHGPAWREGPAAGCGCGGPEEWNGSAVVVWADPSLRLVGLQLEDGENVTARLARAYVRLSDGSLVYGPWLGDSLVGQTVWVHLIGRGSHWMLAEVEAGGEAYIIPGLYAAP